MKLYERLNGECRVTNWSDLSDQSDLVGIWSEFFQKSELVRTSSYFSSESLFTVNFFQISELSKCTLTPEMQAAYPWALPVPGQPSHAKCRFDQKVINVSCGKQDLKNPSESE